MSASENSPSGKPHPVIIHLLPSDAANLQLYSLAKYSGFKIQDELGREGPIEQFVALIRLWSWPKCARRPG